VGLLVVLGLQLSFPSNSVLPFARLNGESVSRQSADKIRTKLQAEYASLPVTVKIAGKQYKTTTTEVGLVPDSAKVIAQLTTYHTWQRLIPFSLPILGLTKNQAVPVQFDDAKFSNYTKVLTLNCAVAPIPVGIMLTGSKVSLAPGKNGQACSEVSIRQAFATIALDKAGTIVRVTPLAVEPAKIEADVTNALAQGQRLVDCNITLRMGSSETSVSKADIAAWLELQKDASTGEVGISVDSAQVQSYLEKAQKAIYIAPGTTRITVVNGVETGRVVGGAGRGINLTATAEALRAQLLQGDGTVQATVIELPANLSYDTPYSNDQAGLQKLLDDLAKTKGNYSIAVHSLASDVTASVNGEQHYHPASTYKMYVGWAIIQQVTAGKLSWNDAAVNGKNVGSCLDTMIINSDNDCGEWLAEKIGWKNLNTMLKGIGLSCTNLLTAWYSCANDETLFLYKLQTGQLLDTSQMNVLLNPMKQQVYRQGIPAGVNVPVADKVGFLYAMLHDSAIVYSPHGTYVLTIMTDGSSWSQIADAAWQIDAQLSRMN
jgi:beta-lactamase class A